MTSRFAWVVDRLPWLSARSEHTDADGRYEVVMLSSWTAFPVDVRRRRSVELRCLSGQLLVTMEGDLEDHVVEAGQSFRVNGRGRLVMAALRPARVVFREARREPGALVPAARQAPPPARAPRLGAA